MGRNLKVSKADEPGKSDGQMNVQLKEKQRKRKSVRHEVVTDQNNSNVTVDGKAKKMKLSNDVPKSVKRRIDFSNVEDGDNNSQQVNNNSSVAQNMQIKKLTRSRVIQDKSKLTKGDKVVNEPSKPISGRVQWTKEFMDKIRRSNERHKVKEKSKKC